MTLRINGFSGMDIDSMVKSLMTAKRVPLDKLNQQKTYLQWQRDSYREMNSKVFDFKLKLTDVFMKSTSLTSQTTTVTGNTDAIKADVTSATTSGTMSVVVKQLATKTTLQSTGKLQVNPEDPKDTAKLTTKLGDLTSYVPVSEPEPSPDDAKTDSFKLAINGSELEFFKDDTISSVLSKINSTANVTASFDEVSGKLSIISKNFGDTKINIEDKTIPSNGITLQSLFNMSAKAVAGQDSEVEVTTFSADGTKMGTNTFTQSKNTVIVNGVTLTLLKETPEGEPTAPSIITLKPDSTKAVDTLKSFVQTYNALLDALSSKSNEEKYRDFAPLTDEQKKDMKESDITAWEAKAKSGLLKNDDILKDTLASMRTIISNNMGQLSALGITTGSYYEGGKLNLDEDKLQNALSNNPQQVADLFQGSLTSASNGIFSKLSTSMTNALQKMSDRAGTNRFSGDLSSAFKDESVMGRQLKGYNSRISDLSVRLKDAETRYYKQFTAMETAMNRMQSQYSSLLNATSSN